MSTSGDIMSTSGGYYEYIEGYHVSVHLGDNISTSEGYHEYIGGGGGGVS